MGTRLESRERKLIERTSRRAMGAAVLASLLVVGAAQAAAPHSKAVLSAYADSAAGESLLAGHYTEVIERLGSHGNEFASDQVGASTNLCVALIMTRQLQAAHSACDEAIEDAKLDVTEETIAARTTHDEEVALAYSNRAVLEWLSDHRTAAADDLSRARAFAPASEFVTQNLTALRASGTPAPAVAAAHG